MSRKIILIKQELLLLVYELNRSGLLAENEKIRPILAQLEKLLLCDLSPSTNDSVKNYLNAKGALTYTDIAGDPVLYGNLPPREISMKDVFRSGDSSKKFKIAEGQWYRYAPSYVSPAYHLLEGFPFIQEPPSGDLQERVLIR